MNLPFRHLNNIRLIQSRATSNATPSRVICGIGFALACVLLFSFGCNKEDRSLFPPAGKRIRTAGKSFAIGSPQKYIKPGVYDNYYKSHGIYLVSDNGMLVALSAQSPNSGNTVRYDMTIDQYVDSTDGSRYTSDGLPTGPKRDHKALERCRIALSYAAQDGPRELIVDPGYRFLFEENTWSNFHGFHRLPEP